MPWLTLLRDWKDGRIKLRVTQELLRFRREHLAILQQGDYEPLAATGVFADKVTAFQRRIAGQTITVIVPRLTSQLGVPPLGLVWEDTALALPPAGAWRDVLTGVDWPGGATTAVGGLFATLPFAVLHAGS